MNPVKKEEIFKIPVPRKFRKEEIHIRNWKKPKRNDGSYEKEGSKRNIKLKILEWKLENYSKK